MDAAANVVIKVEAQASQAIEQITALKAETAKLTEQQKQLDTSTEDGKRKFEAYNAAIKANNAEVRSLQGATQAMAKEQAAAAGSIEQMRAQVASLTKEYTRLSATERESAKGKELQASIKAKSDDLKGLEKAIGDNRRNVGNYAEGFVEAAKSVNVFGVNLGDVRDGLDNAKNGFQAAGGGVKGFTGALMATGLPAIIMLIQTLTEKLSNFKPIADAVERATSALSAAFNALISGGSITEAASQAAELTAALQDLDDAENRLALQQAQTEVTVKRLITASKDRAKTEEQRIALLKAAAATEEANFTDQKRQIDQRLAKEREAYVLKKQITQQELDILLYAKTKEELAEKEKIEAKITYAESELKAINELEIKRVEMEGKSLDLREKIQNRENALVEAIEADKQKAYEKAAAAREKAAQKAAEAAKKQVEEERKAAEELIKVSEMLAQMRIAVVEDEYQRERLAAENASADKLAALSREGKLTTEIITLEQQALNMKLAEIDKKEANDKIQRDKEAAQKLREQMEKIQADKIALIEAEKSERQLLEQSTLEQDIAILTQKAEFELSLAETTAEQKKAIEARLAVDIKRLREADVKNAENAARTKQQNEDAYLNSLQQGLSNAGALLGQNAEAGKALGIANTLISTYSAAQKAFEALSFFPPLAALSAAGVVAQGLMRVNAIASTPIPKFAKGGIIGGRSHSEGGTKFFGTDGSRFEAEKGEALVVVNKHDTPTISTLSAINSRHGRPFGAPSRFLANGGFVATGMTQDAATQAGFEALNQSMTRIPAPIVRVSEINSVQQRGVRVKKSLTL